jgi:hypothetical protein
MLKPMFDTLLNPPHSVLVSSAKRWLKNNGHENCPVVFTEQRCAGNKEIVDAIGFNHLHSVLIEVKVSRSDFLRDKKKPYRIDQESGIGNFRLYLTLPGIIMADDLPEKWGLMYYSDGEIQMIVNPFKGNINSKSPNKFPSNKAEERSLLYSGMRKIANL